MARCLGRSVLPFALFCLLGQVTPSLAQGFVERLEPPVAERGKTTRVTVIGSSLGKAHDLWTTLPAGAIKAVPVGEQTPSRAILDVTVAADAPVGLCGLRLATVDGLGNAILFLIDDLPVRLVAGEKTAKVGLPVALWGKFREAETDTFAIDVAAGQRVSFEAVGNRLGKDVDPLITIRDAKGRLILERDNDPGLYFDFRFEHTFAEAGTYTVEMRDARFHGPEHGQYILRMGRFPAARLAVPMAVRPGKTVELRLPELGDAPLPFTVPNGSTGLFFGSLRRPFDEGSSWVPLEVADTDIIVHQSPGSTMDQATPAKVPAMLCGVLKKPGDRHYFRLELGKGQNIQVRAETRAFNSPADLELALTDKAGKELRRVSENFNEEVVFDFNTGTGGVFGLRVAESNRDGGSAFGYRLAVRSNQLEIQVAAEVEGLTIPRGAYQPVPLTVTRTNYGGAIALKLIGAPAGVTLTPSEIGEGVNTLVCKLAASANVPLGLHTLQILAQPVKAEGAPPTLVHARPLVDRQIVNVDLIPHALREDQRRLPPSLADRFALQITPASVFTVELPEPLVTLGRYQHVEFPVVTTRVPGFTGPITFTARGGQIAAKEEGRTRVYAEFATATAERPGIGGSIHSKILTNTTKHRVEVTGVGTHEGRRISLTRTFDLDIRTAFVVSAEPAKLKLEPGASARVRLLADRVKTFDGDVTVQLSASEGLTMPERVVIPRGQTGVDVDIKIAASRPPGRHNVSLSATAIVNGFEEDYRGGNLEIEVFKTPPPKK